MPTETTVTAIVVRDPFDGHEIGDAIEGAEAERILDGDHRHQVVVTSRAAPKQPDALPEPAPAAVPGPAIAARPQGAPAAS